MACMVIDDNYRCTVAVPGVEVVTVLDDFSGRIISTIHGGALDGERFTAWDGVEAAEQHDRACKLARLAARKRRR